MYLIISSRFCSPDHFYPLVKGWVNGPNILLDTLVLITPVGSVKDGDQRKVTFYASSCACIN